MAKAKAKARVMAHAAATLVAAAVSDDDLESDADGDAAPDQKVREDHGRNAHDHVLDTTHADPKDVKAPIDATNDSERFGVLRLGEVPSESFPVLGKRLPESAARVMLMPRDVGPYLKDLNIGGDRGRYLKTYDGLSQSGLIHTLIAEAMQNATDDMLNRLKPSLCTRPTVDVFRPRLQYSYFGALAVNVDAEKRSLHVTHTTAGTRFLSIYITPAAGGASVQVDIIQHFSDMIAADLIFHSASTKTQTQTQTQTKPASLGGVGWTACAGGHGIGLKQLMAVFASRPGFEFQLFGTVPYDKRSYVSRWQSYSNGSSCGVAADMILRSAIDWPQFHDGLQDKIRSGITPFLCTRMTFPIPAPTPTPTPERSASIMAAAKRAVAVAWRKAGADVLWSAVITSHILFMGVETLSSAVPISDTLMVFKSPNPVSAVYVNGVPIHFRGLPDQATKEPWSDGRPMLSVVKCTDRITQYSREERGSSCNTSLIFYELCDEIASALVKSAEPEWFVKWVQTAYNDPRSAEAGFLYTVCEVQPGPIGLDADRQCDTRIAEIRCAAAKLLKLEEKYDKKCIDEFAPRLAEFKITIPADAVVDTATKSDFFQWLTSNSGGSTFSFRSTRKLLDIAALRSAQVVPLTSYLTDRAHTKWHPFVVALARIERLLLPFRHITASSASAAEGLGLSLFWVSIGGKLPSSLCQVYGAESKVVISDLNFHEIREIADEQTAAALVAMYDLPRVVFLEEPLLRLEDTKDAGELWSVTRELVEKLARHFYGAACDKALNPMLYHLLTHILKTPKPATSTVVGALADQIQVLKAAPPTNEQMLAFGAL
jgi:hypothetical protein